MVAAVAGVAVVVVEAAGPEVIFREAAREVDPEGAVVSAPLVQVEPMTHAAEVVVALEAIVAAVGVVEAADADAAYPRMSSCSFPIYHD